MDEINKDHHQVFSIKWVYPDVHAQTDADTLALHCRLTLEDLQRHSISLEEGLELTFWTDDGNDEGPDPLVFRGVVSFDEHPKHRFGHPGNEGFWVAKMDYAGKKHSSELDVSEIDRFVIDEEWKDRNDIMQRREAEKSQ